MRQTISVRIPEQKLKEIEEISKYEDGSKSNTLREVLDIGIKDKKLEIALEKFRKNEITAWKAARIAELPLSKFLDVLTERGIEFHYGLKELEEDFEGLV